MKNQIPQLCLQGFELSDYVKESISFLKEHEPAEGYFVGFSGGKDSIVTLELCRMAGVKNTPVYTSTRIEPPEMIRFIKKEYPEVKWAFAKENFWDLIQIAGPPTRSRRWCCSLLKEMPVIQISQQHRVMGIRAEESWRRSQRPRIDLWQKKKKKQFLYKPIFYWQEWAIWQFIEERGLPYPSLYDEGFDRVGCCVCPFIFSSSGRKVELYSHRWASVWKVFKHAVRRWWDSMQERRATLKYDCLGRDFEEFWHYYTTGNLIGLKKSPEEKPQLELV